VEKAKAELGQIFEIKDLGEAKWILGMEIKRNRQERTITLNQKQYALEILEQHGMSECKPASTPMIPGAQLLKVEEAEVNIQTYQSAIGSLMYLMLGSRPDLAHSVGALSQFSAKPGKEHLVTIKRVFRYLKGTVNHSILFKSKGNTLPLGYSDSDWATDKNDRRSITGYIFILANGAISWSSKKQSSTALSSTEAEYMAAAHTTKEAVWIHFLLKELGLGARSATIIKMDNQSSISLTKNPEFHSRTKHIDVRYHFIREKMEDKTIRPEYI
ncbi:MAG TPA: hypothetical protein VGO47_07875, partial [Chlamydiales bacterium]|nr:hypothetical protein [Chlamydiales bacterium]